MDKVNPTFSDLPNWVYAICAAALTWIVTIATTRTQLLDHVKSCDDRYEDLKDRFERMEGEMRGLNEYLRSPKPRPTR